MKTFLRPEAATLILILVLTLGITANKAVAEPVRGFGSFVHSGHSTARVSVGTVYHPTGAPVIAYDSRRTGYSYGYSNSRGHGHSPNVHYQGPNGTIIYGQRSLYVDVRAYLPPSRHPNSRRERSRRHSYNY